MKINREESKKKAFAKGLNFNKSITVKTALGIFVVSTLLLLGQANINDSKNNEYNISDTSNSSDIVDTYTPSVNEKSDGTIERENHYEAYANIYKLDPTKVYELASNLTNNFTSEEYLNSLNPGYSVDSITCNSVEKGALIFIRHLYQKPEDFNVDLDYYINQNYKADKTLITNEVRVKHYSDLFDIDPTLVLAIEYQESSKNGKTYNSDACLYHNNPAGIMSYSDSNVIRDFPTIDAGIIEHIYQLKKYYIDEGLTTPEAIREKYSPSNASNDPYDLNKYWVSGVKYFMEQINNTPNIFEQYNPHEEENKLTM